MLGVADHVHIQDSSGMKAVDNCFWSHTNRRDKQFGAAFDDYVYKIIQLSLGVIVTGNCQDRYFSF
jgi:hypothetical protein